MPHPSMMATARSDVWAARESAESSFRKAFNRMDPRVLDRYLEYGLRNAPTAAYTPGDTITLPAGRASKTGGDASRSSVLPTTAVRLTTSKAQEAWAYADLNMDPGNAHLDRLLRADWDEKNEWPRLTGRPELPMALKELEHVLPSTFFVFGNKSPFSRPEEQDLKVKITGTARGGNGGHAVGGMKKEVITGAGHLLVFENVDKAADVGAEWIGQCQEQWRKDQAILRSHDTKKSEDGAMLSLSQE